MIKFFVNKNELLTRDEYDSTRVGLNLIRGSEMTKSSSYAWETSGAQAVWTDHLQVLKNDVMQYIIVKPNTTYTFSFVLDYLDVAARDTGFYFVEQKSMNTNTDEYKDNQYSFVSRKIKNTAGLYSYTFVTGPQCKLLQMRIRYLGNDSNGLMIRRVKLEEGSAVTQWIPSLDDYAKQSDMISLQDQINQIKSKMGG